MEKKTKIILGVIASLILLLSIFLIYKNYKIAVTGSFISQRLEKNLSFQTDYAKDIPYKKGDEIEISYIIENNEDYNKYINLNKDDSKDIDISDITINGKEAKSIGNLKVEANSVLQINIKGKAKTNKIYKNNDENIVKVEKVEKVEKKVEEENKLDFSNIDKGIQISKNKYNSNIDNLLIINYSKPELVDYILIGEKSFKISQIKDKNIYINIAKNIFGTGEYFIVLVLKNGEFLTYNGKIYFEYDSNKVSIFDILPTKLKNDTDRQLSIYGVGFNKIIGVQFSNNIILKKTDFSVITDNILIVKIPKGLSSGTYYLNLMDMDSIYEIKNKIFNITK